MPQKLSNTRGYELESGQGHERCSSPTRSRCQESRDYSAPTDVASGTHARRAVPGTHAWCTVSIRTAPPPPPPPTPARISSVLQPASPTLTPSRSGFHRAFLWHTAGVAGDTPHINPSHPDFCGCGALPVWIGCFFFRLLHHASLWAVFCVTPVLHTSCGMMGLICSHGRGQSSNCDVVVTLSRPRMSVGCLRDIVLMRCALCAIRD